MSYWRIPLWEEGFYVAVRTLISQPAAMLPVGLTGLDSESLDQAARKMGAEDVVLSWLGSDQNSWEPRLRDELLTMPGWLGRFSQLENDPALFPHDPVPCSLVDFLAVRLTMMQVAQRNQQSPQPPAPADPQFSRPAGQGIRGRGLRLDAATLVPVCRRSGVVRPSGAPPRLPLGV